MADNAKIKGGSIIPALRYRDAPAAIEWLCKAFGFARQLVVPGEGNTIAHAQLTSGTGMIMLGSAADTPYGRLVTYPDSARPSTQSIYMVVPDADVHHTRAIAAGAEVVIPLVDQDYGGRDYTCRDIEGHIWTFGTYDPWKDHG